jgi:hypothetical protein
MPENTVASAPKQAVKKNEALSFGRVFVALVCMAISLLYVGPLLLYSANEADFPHFRSVQFLAALAPLAIKSLLAITVCAAIAQLIERPRLRAITDACLLFIAVALTSFACYFPLAVGKLDGVDGITVDLPNLALGLAVGLAAVLLRAKATLILFLIMVGPLFTSTLALFEESHKESAERFLPFSKTQKNVLLVSLDNLQSSHVERMLKSDSEPYDGFVLYPGVTAVGPFSALSTLTTKLGQLPELPEGAKASVFFRDEFISTKLQEGGFAVETYGDFGQAEKAETLNFRYFSHVNDKPASSYFNMLEMSLLRVIPSPTWVSLGIYVSWPILTWPNSSQVALKNESDLAVLTENDRHPLAHYKLDILQFDAFVNSITAEDVGPTARLHHYLFTHEPVRFSENCEYFYGTGFRYVTALPAETACAIEKVKLLINKLKEVGVFNNTMIIFASDHGPECPLNFTFEPGSHRVSRRWCLSRYQPFLLIKDFDSTEELSLNSGQVSLLDIAKTICSATLPSAACSSYSGSDLLSEVTGGQLAKRFILVSETAEDRRDYNSFFKLEIPRDQNIVEFFGLNPDADMKSYAAKDLPSRTGTLTQDGRRASVGDARGFTTYGPYAHLWPGRYIISVEYSLANEESGRESRWEVTAERGASKLFKGTLGDTRGEMAEASFEFDAEDSVANLELRTIYGGEGTLIVKAVTIKSVHQID